MAQTPLAARLAAPVAAPTDLEENPGSARDGRQPADRSGPAGHTIDRSRDEQASAGEAIVMNELGRRFGDFVAVDSITATVPAGTILGLIGPSGSGKTTTVRLLTGALRPTHGTVRVLGEDPISFGRGTRERIGYMPQSFVLYPDLTAQENVGFVGSMFGMLWRRRRRRVREVLELVELWEFRGRRASQLSGGMQRRLELACALVHEPLVLFLDEPTAGIDPILRQQIWAELRRLRDSGRTLVVTTQYVGEAEYCDSVALLAGGRLIASDTPEGLRRAVLGGDVVEMETRESFDVRTLRGVPGVRAVRQRSPNDGFVIVDNAGAAMPALVERAGAEGIGVTSTREFRPPFDEVFAELVARDEARSDAAASDDGKAAGAIEVAADAPNGPAEPGDER